MTSDDDIWAAYAKSVKPIKRIKKKPVVAGKKNPKPDPSPAKTFSPRAGGNPRIRKAAADKQGQRENHPIRTVFSRNVERDLHSGAIEIDARIDLHGMREAEAYEALMRFIARTIKAEQRRLLIVTGKGRDGEGLLKSSLSGWLAGSLYAGQVLDLRPAAPKHGGSGAFYITLRRRRD